MLHMHVNALWVRHSVMVSGMHKSNASAAQDRATFEQVQTSKLCETCAQVKSFAKVMLNAQCR